MRSHHCLRTLLFCAWSLISCQVIAQIETPTEKPLLDPTLSITEDSYAAIESAEYEATFADGDLSSGKLNWQLLHRGPNPSVIEITKANLAISDLRSGTRKINWGTTQQDRRVLIVDPQTVSIQGSWSLHGRRFPGRVIFDCNLPPALNSQLTIHTPSELFVQSSVGIVRSERDSTQPGFHTWKIDLGRQRNASISLTSENIPKEIIQPKVEVEEVLIARQDGIFVQTDFTIDGLNLERSSEIEILTPSSLVLQSVTSNSVPLAYDQDSDKKKNIRIMLPMAVSGSRVNLRVQGFRPVRWVRKQTLPSLKLLGGIESRRVTSLRVESPLELHSIERLGYFQTGLTKESRGEIWRFEAFEENPNLIVDLGQPRYSLKSEIHSLHYLDTPLPWTASKITTSVKSGRLFEQTIVMPDDCVVVSVQPLDSESEISSWSVNQQLVEISFKEPISSESKKTIQILARSPRPPIQHETPFPVVMVKDATATSLQSDWILSAGSDIDLENSIHWSKLTSEIDLTQFPNLPKLTQLSRNQVHRSFFNSNFNTDALPIYRILSIKALETASVEDSNSIDEHERLPQIPREDSSLPAIDLQLLTQAESLGDLTSPRLVHHATMNVLGKVSPHSFHLLLNEDSLLSSVTVDGKAVMVFREGKRITFPEDVQSFSEVTLIYITNTQRNLLTEDCRIPLPEYGLALRNFDWTLELPPEHRLTTFELAGTQRTLNSDHFFFGPLTSHWRLFSSSHDSSTSADSQQGTKRYHFYSLEVGPELHFQAWNSLQTLNLSWAVFFACLIIGVGGRLLRSKLLQRSSLYWIGSLVLLQFFVANEYSMIVGAMLIGTLLSMLFPVRLLHLSEFRGMRAPASKLAPATAVVCLFVSHFSSAQNLSIATESFASVDNIRYLLRSVQYELLSSTPSKRYQAKIEVLTPRDNEETLVELPYQGAVFQSGAECLVDGQQRSLIPAVSGNGVVVRIPRHSQAGTEVVESIADQNSSWSKHVIQFEFLLKDQAGTASESSLPPIRFPVIQDSILTFHEDLKEDLSSVYQVFERQGQIRENSESETEIELGPISSPVKPKAPEMGSSAETEFYTLLNISAARIAGQLFVPSKKTSQLQQLILKIPTHAVITNVTGQGIAGWFDSIDLNRNRTLVIEFKRDAIDEDFVVNFYLPTTVNTLGEIVVPEFSWGESFEGQILGIKVANGIKVSIAPDQATIAEVDPQLWPQNELLGRNRPNHIFRLLRAQPFRLSLQELAPSTTHSITEKLTVARTNLYWQAEIELDVVDVPLFVHHFTISSGLRITSVKSNETGENAFVRFHQSGRDLSIFFPGGQLGARKLILNGDMAFTPETLRVIPTIQLKDSELLKETFTILDQTNWDIELAMPGGTTINKKSYPSENFNGERSIGVFSSNSMNRPTQIKLLPPPSATRVDIASRIQIDGTQSWNCVQLLHFSGDVTPLKKAIFRVPNTLRNLRIGPRYFQSKSIVYDTETEYVVDIPDRFTTGVTLQVYSKLSEGVIQDLLSNTETGSGSEIPGVRIISARTVSQYLFFNDNRYVTTPALEALPVERKNLPEWIPLQWKEAVTNLRLLSYQVIEGSPQFIPEEVHGSSESPSLRFAETLVWPSREGITLGKTRLWLTGAQSFSYRLPFQNFVQIKRVYQSKSGELPLRSTAGGTVVDVISSEAVIPIEVYWEFAASEKPGNSQILESSSTPEIPHLIGLIDEVSQPQQKISKINSVSIDAVLARWKALLEIAKSMQVPIAVESGIYRDLQETNSFVNEILANENLTQAQTQMIEKLDKNWADIRSELTISAGPVLAQSEVGNASFGLLLGPQNQIQSVDWSLPGSAAKMPASLKTSLPRWLPFVMKIVLISGGLILFILFRKTVERIVVTLEQSPVVRLLMIGCLWFFFLQPILIGFIFITLALTLHFSSGTTPENATT